MNLSKEELQTVKDWMEEHKRLTDLTKEKRPDIFPKDEGKKLKELVKEAGITEADSEENDLGEVELSTICRWIESSSNDQDSLVEYQPTRPLKLLREERSWKGLLPKRHDFLEYLEDEFDGVWFGPGAEGGSQILLKGYGLVKLMTKKIEAKAATSRLSDRDKGVFGRQKISTLVKALARLVQRSEASPEKYSHIDFSPPEGARNAAERGLLLRKEHGRGGTEVGVARARDLKNGRSMSPSTVRRMFSFFSRHEVDKSSKAWKNQTTSNPSTGYIAWLLWGGDPGFAWARKIVKQMDAADTP